jgi:hypothetical protein
MHAHLNRGGQVKVVREVNGGHAARAQSGLSAAEFVINRVSVVKPQYATPKRRPMCFGRSNSSSNATA